MTQAITRSDGVVATGSTDWSLGAGSVLGASGRPAPITHSITRSPAAVSAPKPITASHPRSGDGQSG